MSGIRETKILKVTKITLGKKRQNCCEIHLGKTRRKGM